MGHCSIEMVSMVTQRTQIVHTHKYFKGTGLWCCMCHSNRDTENSKESSASIGLSCVNKLS